MMLAVIQIPFPPWHPQIAIGSSVILAAVIVLSLPSDAKLMAHDIAVARNFYGVLQVSEQHEGVPEYHRRVMVHGRTIHGIQYVDAQKRELPTSYYGAESGVGQALRLRRRQVGSSIGPGALKVGITGLGIGTVAAFGSPGDTYRFYEINPDVVRFARDPALFTYLADSKATVEIVLGDARISLERELRNGSQRFDVMVLDAFSGDAIPAHLLTREAFALYLRHLREPDGVIAINVTNRVLNLRPVVFSPGDRIIRAGELGFEMYFISQGSVDVLSADEKAVYASLTAGQFFGEIALLLSKPRNATVRAREYCDLYRLDKESFDRVVGHYPAFADTIRELAAKRDSPSAS